MQLPGKPGTTDCWSAANDNCSLLNDTTPKICAERKGVGCSQCHYGCVNNSQAEINGMQAYDESLRMLVIAESGSHFPATPRPQAENVNTGWLKPSAMGGGFSAVCYFFGRDLSKTLRPARPIGLVQAAVGGTSLQYWSSDAAIAKCQSLGKPWQWPADCKIVIPFRLVALSVSLIQKVSPFQSGPARARRRRMPRRPTTRCRTSPRDGMPSSSRL